MTETELEMLIAHGEDSHVEWKCPLELGSKWHRAEFVRDMLAMVNAHGRQTAYILVGIDRQGQEHDMASLLPDDAQLQQQVNSLVDPPIRFVLRPHGFRDVTIGVIEVSPSDDRFHLVKRDFGDGGGDRLLTQGETWIRYGSGKRRPTPWDYKLLKEDFARGQVSVPSIDLLFADGSRELTVAADWHPKQDPPSRSFGGYDPYRRDPLRPGTAAIGFRVSNAGTTEARNIRVFITPDGDCHAYERRGGVILSIPDERRAWYEWADDDGSIVIRGDSLIHRLSYSAGPLLVQFPRPAVSYEFRWRAVAGNMPDEATGVLIVHLLGLDAPPPKWD